VEPNTVPMCDINNFKDATRALSPASSAPNVPSNVTSFFLHAQRSASRGIETRVGSFITTSSEHIRVLSHAIPDNARSSFARCVINPD